MEGSKNALLASSTASRAKMKACSAVELADCYAMDSQSPFGSNKRILTCTLSSLITAPSTVSLTPSPTFISPIFFTNLTIPFNVFFPS